MTYKDDIALICNEYAAEIKSLHRDLDEKTINFKEFFERNEQLLKKYNKKAKEIVKKAYENIK